MIITMLFIAINVVFWPLFLFFNFDQSGGWDLTDGDAVPKPPAIDPWTRIASHLPRVARDLHDLRDHWTRIDVAFGADAETNPDEHAIRRCLTNDLPMIADALDEAITTADSEKSEDAARAVALDSVMATNAIMKAHLATLHRAASDAQGTVSRYLESKRDDVSPTGPLTPLRIERNVPMPQMIMPSCPKTPGPMDYALAGIRVQD
jgi:hypothetical protein